MIKLRIIVNGILVVSSIADRKYYVTNIYILEYTEVLTPKKYTI